MLQLIEDFQCESASNDEIADLFVWVKGDDDIPDTELDRIEANAKKYISDNKDFYKEFDKVYLHFTADDGEEITMFPFYLDSEGNIAEDQDE